METELPEKEFSSDYLLDTNTFCPCRRPVIRHVLSPYVHTKLSVLHFDSLPEILYLLPVLRLSLLGEGNFAPRS